MEFIDLKAQYRRIQSDVDARIHRVLEHGQYILGPEVAELESALARFVGAEHCITVASGTEALLISLMASGIGHGDEVITTPFSFAATVEVIVLLGAIPVFVDVEADTGLIDSSCIEAAITPRTKAIIPVSLYGQMPDMEPINALAARHGLVVVEDAAQSFGATYRDSMSCNASGIGCTSFFPSKPLGCYGDGGAIFTSDAAIATACREIRVHGQSGRYHHTRVGVGGRMDTIQCAVVLAKLRVFDWELQRRREIAERYSALIAQACERVAIPVVRAGRSCVWAQYTVRVSQRERIQALLKAGGIPTAVHYPKSLHHQPAYSRYADAASCPNSGDLARTVLSVPMGPDLSAADQDAVVDALASAVEQAG